MLRAILETRAAIVMAYIRAHTTDPTEELLFGAVIAKQRAEERLERYHSARVLDACSCGWTRPSAWAVDLAVLTALHGVKTLFRVGYECLGSADSLAFNTGPDWGPAINCDTVVTDSSVPLNWEP